MEARFFNDPAAFLDEAAGYIRSEPFSSSVIGVWTDGVLAGTRPHQPDDSFMIVSDSGTVVGAAMHTPPFHLFLARMSAEAATCLANAIADQDRRPTGVNGEAKSVNAFAEAWLDRVGEPSRADTNTRLYYLSRLTPPTGVDGVARLVSTADLPLITKWMAAFHHEAAPLQPDTALTADPRRYLAGGLYLWEVGPDVVSLAQHSALVEGVSRVGPVYTPPARRRHGYAAAVTAYVSQAARDSGATDVILYTNLANPTSNAIYQSIGYVADHDAVECSFVTPAG